MEAKTENKSKLSIRRFLGLYALYAKMDATWFLRDTRLCVLAVFADIILNLSAISGVFLLSQRFGGVGSMSRSEVLFMMGYVTTVIGIFLMFFNQGNVGHVSRRIGRGQVDHMLIQPLPLSIQLVTEGFMPFSGSGNLITGIGIIAYSLRKLSAESVTPLFFLLLVCNLLCTVTIIIGLSYIFSSLAFYAPVAAEEVSTHVIDLINYLGNFPLSGMSVTVQVVLVSVLPVGLMAWFPANALLGKAPLGLPGLYPFIIAVLLAALAVQLFKKGLNHYVKIGSNRYSAMGHRR